MKKSYISLLTIALLASGTNIMALKKAQSGAVKPATPSPKVVNPAPKVVNPVQPVQPAKPAAPTLDAATEAALQQAEQATIAVKNAAPANIRPLVMNRIRKAASD